jgi:AMP nucleosidase
MEHSYNDNHSASIISRDEFGISTLERYTGSKKEDFQPYILLTNFRAYVHIFASKFNLNYTSGTAMSVCHSKEEKISIIEFGVGSPLAALIIELLSFLKPKAALMLGLCGGLRDNYTIGDYFNPVAAIREEGTSNAYLPTQCPSLSSFIIQRYVCSELDKQKIHYHTGVIHTTNVRFWEFNDFFKSHLEVEKCQAIDMECATLFTVGFVKFVPVGALMMISDLPLKPDGLKTSQLQKKVSSEHTTEHINIGINTLKSMQKNENNGFSYQF